MSDISSEVLIYTINYVVLTASRHGTYVDCAESKTGGGKDYGFGKGFVTGGVGQTVGCMKRKMGLVSHGEGLPHLIEPVLQNFHNSMWMAISIQRLTLPIYTCLCHCLPLSCNNDLVQMALMLQDFPLELLTWIARISVTVTTHLDPEPDHPNHHPFWAYPLAFQHQSRSDLARTYPYTCKSFYHASLPTIMEHITISSIEQLEGLAGLIRSGPVLSEDLLIGQFTIRLDLVLPESYPLHHVINIIDAMPTLEVLLLANGGPSIGRSSRWHDIPNDFLANLVKSSPRLRRIQFLSDYELPTVEQVAFLSTGLVHLQTLQLTRLHPRLQTESFYRLPFSFPNLTTLSLGPWINPPKDGVLFSFLECLISSDALPSLRRFDILDRTRNLYRFLRSHGNHLQHLTLISGASRGEDLYCPLSLCPGLKSLSFVVEGGRAAFVEEHSCLEEVRLLRSLKFDGKNGGKLLKGLLGINLKELRSLHVDVELPLSIGNPWIYDTGMDSFTKKGSHTSISTFYLSNIQRPMPLIEDEHWSSLSAEQLLINFKKLPFLDLVQLVQDTRYQDVACQAILDIVEDLFLLFNLNPSATFQIMRRTCTVLSGSAHDGYVVSGHEESLYNSDDISSDSDEDIPKSGLGIGIKTVFTLTHQVNGKKLNIIQSASSSPLVPIAFFHSTLVMNFVHADGLVCAYPDLTFNNIGLLSTYTMHPSNSGSIISTRLIGALLKYQERGFTLIEGERDDLHQAIRQKERTWSDSSSLHLCFRTPEDINYLDLGMLLTDLPWDVLSSIIKKTVATGEDLDDTLPTPTSHPFDYTNTPGNSFEILSSFALASKAVYHAALPTVWEHVNIPTISQLHQVASILKDGTVFDPNIPLQSYVRRLNITLSHDINNEDALTILQSLPRLKVLVIMPGYCTCGSPHSFSPELIITIATRLTHLRRLQFTFGCQSPTFEQLSILTSTLKKLRTLQFHDIAPPRLDELKTPATTIHLPHLATLSIGSWFGRRKNGDLTRFIKRLLDEDSLPAIRRFDLFDKCKQVKEFLKIHGKHLRHLSFSSEDESITLSPSHLDLCPNLKSLTLAMEGHGYFMPKEWAKVDTIYLAATQRMGVLPEVFEFLEDLLDGSFPNLHKLYIDTSIPDFEVDGAGDVVLTQLVKRGVDVYLDYYE
ncbi:hypothetical protein NMY22_g8136 [Coprinellus aureogranulatus]|nr:hypothetical protein NMY22_g8136 [Coprinellus aureogranulatus]